MLGRGGPRPGILQVVLWGGAVPEPVTAMLPVGVPLSVTSSVARVTALAAV